MQWQHPAGCAMPCNAQWQQAQRVAARPPRVRVAARAHPDVLRCAVPFTKPQWQQAKQFFVDNFLEHAKALGLEDSCWLHLVKESR